MNLNDAINTLGAECKNPNSGLPEPVFLLLSRLTPLVNVDLLIKDDMERTLLTWRDDIYHGSGWHIPGGIVRFKEVMHERVRVVARLELGCEVVCEPSPVAINEYIEGKRSERGHFISFLYRCKLASSPLRQLEYQGGELKPGMYKFFSQTPENLLTVQDRYRKYIDSK